jgi:hypothetical protein
MNYFMIRGNGLWAELCEGDNDNEMGRQKPCTLQCKNVLRATDDSMMSMIR